MGVTDKPGLIGKSAVRWETEVRQHHDAGEQDGLSGSLTALRTEIAREQACIDQLEKVPWYRRSATGPEGMSRAQLSELKNEVASERRVERIYTEAMARAALPECIWPYLKMAPAMVRPDAEGIQFDGFGKYGCLTGRADHQAVTFFAGKTTQGVPPHFFTSYDAQQQRFTIERAYRRDLPAGSAATIVAEQARRMSGSNGIKRLGLKNVVNRPTYDAYVGPDRRLRQNVDFAATPLGKHAAHVLELLGLEAGAAQAHLTGYGELHIDIEVRPRSR